MNAFNAIKPRRSICMYLYVYIYIYIYIYVCTHYQNGSVEALGFRVGVVFKG